MESKHLFTPDYSTTNQYLRDAPYTTTLPIESPGRAGVWIGFRIVNAYMKHNPKTSLQQLMEATDSQAFLQASKYKP